MRTGAALRNRAGDRLGPCLLVTGVARDDGHLALGDDLLVDDQVHRLAARDRHVDEGAVRERAGRILELVRGGSAIGGSSVFFE